MALLLAFAFFSGIVTVLSPCVLPVLPVLLSGALTGGRRRPLGVIIGFALTFSLITLALSAIVSATGISPDALRLFATILIALFGLVLLLPALGGRFEVFTSRIAGRFAGGSLGPADKGGFGGGLLVGFGLGLLWTPCVGPIMASVTSLALTRSLDGGAVGIALAYSLGTSLSMFAFMLGGRGLVSRVAGLRKRLPLIQRGFGALLLVLALALSQGWDRQFQSSVLSLFPNYATTLTSLENVAPVRAVLTQRVGGPAATLGGGSEAASVFAGLPEGSPAGVLGDFGQAPELVAAGPWFNGAIPDMGSLRGKVVLVDFWTYSCVNCLRTLPWLKAMYAKYRDAGFVIIGVHTPEFEFEKSSANVKTAIADLGVAWPVVQDNDYSQWKAYSNSYWPSHFLIDAKGAVRNVHYGEGAYAETEALIQKLLVSVPGATGLVAKSTDAVSTPAASAGPVNTASTVNAASSVNAASPAGSGANPLTPETYLGYARARGFVSTVDPVPDKPTRYAANPRPGEGRWSLGGTWTIRSEFIEAGGGGSLTLGFDASDVFLVIEPVSSGGSLEVWLDGKPAADTADVKGGLLRPDKSRLYHLVGNRERGSHLLELRVKGGERFFAFTFG